MSRHEECSSCAIRHRALCGALDVSEIKELNVIARHKSVAAGRPIISHLDRTVSFANIVSGVVKLFKRLPDGRTQIVGLQFASDFLGRPFQSEPSYEIEAATDVELCTFDRAAFERLIAKHPKLEHRLLEFTLNELDATRDWMLVLGRQTAREKLASFLSLVAKRSSGEGCAAPEGLNFSSFDLPLTRSDIADLLGLTMETVSRQLSKLKAEGIIHIEGGRRVTVPDLGKLHALAEFGESR